MRSPNTLSVEEDVPCAPRLHSPVSPVRGISYPPLSPKSLVRSAAIQPPVSRNPPLVKARSGSAMSEPPPGPQITVISDPAETVESVQGEEGRNKRGQGRAERPDTRRYLLDSEYDRVICQEAHLHQPLYLISVRCQVPHGRHDRGPAKGRGQGHIHPQETVLEPDKLKYTWERTGTGISGK